MAVTMEVAWRGAELGGGSGGGVSGKKRAWGADAEKLMRLMMGQFGSVEEVEVTLDLLGAAASGGGSGSPGRGGELDCNSSPEFLELDPDQPLPCGWEKCLDLKAGELYFVNKSTGVRTSEDPRKQSQLASTATEAPATSRMALEFLGSKMSETLREESLRTSTSSGSSGGSPRDSKPAQLLSFSTGKQLWNLQLDDRRTVSLNMTGSPRAAPDSSDEESNLELNLNLSAGGNSPSHQHHQQSVCTMEMVEKALKWTEKAMGKREMPSTSFGPKVSGSSSFSSLTSARSEPNSWSHSSPSTSSSSSTSSRSAAWGTSAAHHDDSQQAFRSSSAAGICEADSRKAETTTDAFVMGACTRCLMYVMLHKSDPKCPRCESDVPLDFSSPPSKRQRVETVVQTS